MIDFDKFQKKYKLDGIKQGLAKAMVLSGAKEDNILKAVKGYSFSKNTKINNNMVCPRCGSTMIITAISDKKNVRYCTNDRVTLPLYSNSNK